MNEKNQNLLYVQGDKAALMKLRLEMAIITSNTRNCRHMKANVKLIYLFPSIECCASIPRTEIDSMDVNIIVSMMKAICCFVLDAD